MRRLVWPAMLCIWCAPTRMWRLRTPRGPQWRSIITSRSGPYGPELHRPGADTGGIGFTLVAVLILVVLLAPLTALAASCTHRGVELQVLGSGGPELEDQRASSSYLIWQDGRPRILVDSGGGSALQFGRSGAHVEQLDAILFTHLHIDHTADFPALIKSSYFEERKQPLLVYGPGGNADFPATTEFVADLFDAKRGAYRYLSDFLSGGEGGYKLVVHDVFLPAHAVRTIFTASDVSATATPVIHGGAAAIAWRVSLGGKNIVFSGDTNGDNGNLERLAKDADIFVAHNAIPEGETGVVRQLHMPPSVIGRISAAANVKALVLSHRMLRSLGHESQTRALIAAKYSGPVAFADDLDCFH
jgi:ribonuclease BN (tRNA processing enzyme)